MIAKSAPRRKKQSLKLRLAEACAAVPALDKEGHNPEYNYVRASQIFTAFRKELLNRDILLLPNELEVREQDVPTVAGPTLNRVTLHVEYELSDCRGVDEPIVKKAFGVGIDPGDKAIYKAKTGALKYFFRVLGIIPWLESDDAEADADIDDMTNPEVYAEPGGKKARMRVMQKQVRAFDSACHQGGKTAEQIKDYLRTKFDVATITDLARGDFNEAIKWAYGAKEQVVDAIETSIRVINEKKAAQAQPMAIVPEIASGD